MNPIFVVKVEREIMENHEPQNAGSKLTEYAMFQELEYAIAAIERYIAEAVLKHKLLLQLRSEILEAFGIKEKPEAETPRGEAEKPAPESPPVKPADPRLAILEKGIKKVIGIFKKTRMLKNSKSLKLLLKTLIEVLGKSDEPDAVRIVKMETAIGEMLSQLHSSKMASRSKVLMEIKRILEETIDRKNQA